MGLREIRLDRGWSQVTLGKRSGVRSQTINDMERGYNRNPSYRNVAALARALGVRPEDIWPMDPRADAAAVAEAAEPSERAS